MTIPGRHPGQREEKITVIPDSANKKGTVIPRSAKKNGTVIPDSAKRVIRDPRLISPKISVPMKYRINEKNR